MQVQDKTSLVLFDTFGRYYYGLKYMHCIMCSSIQLCEAAFWFSSFGYSFSCTFNLVAHYYVDTSQKSLIVIGAEFQYLFFSNFCNTQRDTSRQLTHLYSSVFSSGSSRNFCTQHFFSFNNIVYICSF